MEWVLRGSDQLKGVAELLLALREQDPEYGEHVCTWLFDKRVEAFLVEQAIFHATNAYAACPDELRDWSGKTEVRKMPAVVLVDLAEFYKEEMIRLGIWRFIPYNLP